HRKDCPNIQGTKSRLNNGEWDETISKQQYEANLTMLSHDRNFLITDIVTVVSQCKANLMGINSVVNSEDLTATTKMNILVDDIEHLQNVIANLKKVNSVITVERQIL
ncbi:MAG: ACT domain-containing protein, partial [Longicatena sp.]